MAATVGKKKRNVSLRRKKTVGKKFTIRETQKNIRDGCCLRTIGIGKLQMGWEKWNRSDRSDWQMCDGFVPRSNLWFAVFDQVFFLTDSNSERNYLMCHMVDYRRSQMDDAVRPEKMKWTYRKNNIFFGCCFWCATRDWFSLYNGLLR